MTALFVRKPTIDCSAIPRIPKDMWIRSHRKMGAVRTDFENVPLYLAESQKHGQIVRGTALRQELAELPLMNACVLDFLLENRSLIPSFWKRDDRDRTIYTYFWGTEYIDEFGDLRVRYLHWDGGAWSTGISWVAYMWDDRRPAALLADAAPLYGLRHS